MSKQFISEAQRMQKLANMPISEMAIPEMARTAGTGGAYTITEKGEEILKQTKASGKAPEGIKNSEIAALVFLFKAKKDGKRVQKIDYAKERNVPQPAVNPIFNSLEVKELVTREGYTSKQQEPKTSRPRPDVGSMLGDLDIEEGKSEGLNEDSIPYARWKSALENFIATNLTNDIDEIDMLNDILRKIIADGEKELMSGNLDIKESKKTLKEDIFNDIDQDLMQGLESQEDQIEYLKEVISYCQAKIKEIESNLDESKKTLSEDDEEEDDDWDVNQDWNKIKLLGTKKDHQGTWVVFLDPEDPYAEEEGYSFAIEKRQIEPVKNGEKNGVEDGSSVSHYMSKQDAKNILSKI